LRCQSKAPEPLGQGAAQVLNETHFGGERIAGEGKGGNRRAKSSAVKSQAENPGSCRRARKRESKMAEGWPILCCRKRCYFFRQHCSRGTGAIGKRWGPLMIPWIFGQSETPFVFAFVGVPGYLGAIMPQKASHRTHPIVCGHSRAVNSRPMR
jgi:hypothetical protein